MVRGIQTKLARRRQSCQPTTRHCHGRTTECRAIAELLYAPERMAADYVEAFHAVAEDARSAFPLARRTLA